MRKKLLHLVLAVALLLVSVTPAFAQETPDTPDAPDFPSAEEVFGANAVFLPFLSNVRDTEVAAEEVAAGAAAARVLASPRAELALESPVESAPRVKLDPALQGATGRQHIVVRMTNASVSEVVGAANADRNGQRSARDRASAQQDALVQWVLSRDASAKVVDRLTIALNAVIMDVDASILPELVSRPGVQAVSAVVDYELDLSETVPYIGASAAQAAGFDGSGVVVAVLDSGIDYTHRNLGGSGNVADYLANDPTIIEPGTFPTAKVVGGTDFVGATWPDTDLIPDPDPLDDGPDGGHGTHVADIIAGKSSDGTHKGVAPGASLVAVKVCSSVSTSCSGVALLQGMEFALDPNRDGDIADRVDVVNMSLGTSYGQKEDDLSLASQNAVRAGVVVVASAGNSADRPYIVGSPSSQQEVISVAQTQVPSAVTYALRVNTPASIAGLYKNTETVPWAPISADVTGDVVFVGRGCPAGSVSATSPDDPYLADPAGKIALIDRGACSISLKVDRAAKAGATAVLIGLVAGGDAVSFSYGGGDTFVPTLIIIQSTSNAIKARLAAGETVNATIAAADSTPLVGSMVGSSSRGPTHSYNVIKPDIGAPGASMSAVYGTGTGEEAFGGTSGAAPMVSGSAALLVQAYPNARPSEIKARLMNTADTNILTNPATQPGVLAPITRIGGGEVRVMNAIRATTAAWDADARTGSLSFGYQAITHDRVFFKRLRIENFSNRVRTYSLTPQFRYADDAASGAVSISAPSSVNVPPRGSRVVLIKLSVDAEKLPAWGLNGGSRGGTGALLQGNEFDGYIQIADAKDSVHVAWQILPRKAAQAIAWPGSGIRISEADASAADASAADASAADASVDASHGGGGHGGGNNKQPVVWVSNGGVLDGYADVFALLGTSPRISRKDLPMPGDNFAVVDLRAAGARLVDFGDGLFGLDIGITTFGTRAHPAYPAGFEVYFDINRDGTDDYVAYTLENGGFAATGQTVVAVANLSTGSGPIRFYLDADLNSANAIMTVLLPDIGITNPATQIGISVYAYDNYFTGFYTDAIEGIVFNPGIPRYYTDADPVTIPARSAVALKVYKDPAGNVASPSQNGLLLLYRQQAPGFEADIVTVR